MYVAALKMNYYIIGFGQSLEDGFQDKAGIMGEAGRLRGLYTPI